MALSISTIRPGLLVSLSTTIRGGVSYETKTIEAERITEDGAQVAKWETDKRVEDAAEHERAVEARSKARHCVTRICSRSNFGLLCTQEREAELAAAVEEARSIAAGFNETARHSEITVYVMTGRVAADDAEAVRAINSEVRGLLEDMETGVRNLDADAIRKAANSARDIGAMLSPSVAARVQDAIEAARSAARKIVKAGESAAVTVDVLAVAKIRSARTEFLDLSDAADVAAPSAAARAVDLEPDAEAPAWRQEVERFGASLDMDAPPPAVIAAPAAPLMLEF